MAEASSADTCRLVVTERHWFELKTEETLHFISPFVMLCRLVAVANDDASLIDDQRTWSVKKCAAVFSEAVCELAKRAKQEQDMLVWDKVGLS